MNRFYPAAFFCVVSIGCSDPSCPEGQIKIGTVCHRPADAGSEAPDDALDHDAGQAATAGDGSMKADTSADSSTSVEADASVRDSSQPAADSGMSSVNVPTQGDAASTNVDLCASNNGGCDAKVTCAVVGGKVTCGPCPDGFSGDGASGCMQAPACANNPCGENASCAAATNATGYTCSCKEGFALESGKCADIDECFEGTHTCHMTAKCENTAGSFDCTCPLGYSGGTKAGFACAPRVVVGAGFACALQDDGRVKCWGSNDAGQLGDGTQLAQATPVYVKALDHVIAIAAHDSGSACALRDDATVVCWGDNSLGQIGDGTNQTRATPVSVKNLGNVVALSVGVKRACAVTKDGGLQCWGNDGTGSASPWAARIGGVPSVTNVELGVQHGCGITAAGTVWCWADAASPAQVQGLSNVLHVSAGATSACAVHVDNSMTCWKYDTMPLNSIKNVVSASESVDLNYAVQVDGSVFCWTGALPSSNAQTPCQTAPIDAVVVASGGLGSPSACAVVRDGTLRCWGININGSLGDGTSMSTTLTDGVFAVTTVSGLDLW